MTNGFSALAELPLYQWILIAAILFSQGIWLFTDAGKRGGNKWLWGLWGLIQAPTPLVVYLIFKRKIFKNKKGQEPK